MTANMYQMEAQDDLSVIQYRGTYKDDRRTAIVEQMELTQKTNKTANVCQIENKQEQIGQTCKTISISQTEKKTWMPNNTASVGLKGAQRRWPKMAKKKPDNESILKVNVITQHQNKTSVLALLSEYCNLKNCHNFFNTKSFFMCR